MASPLDAECLLATIGVDKVLEGKCTLHKHQLVTASEMPKEMRKRILRWLATDEWATASDTPDLDYPAVKKLLSVGPTTEQAAALHRAVPDPDMATEMGTEVERIQQWANTVFPRETRETVVGPVDEMPAPATLADFSRLWEVACDPMSVVRDLTEGDLGEDQVAALATCWPALFAEMQQAMADSIIVMRGRRKTWEPSEKKAAQIDTLKQVDAFDPDLSATIQGIYSAEDQTQPPNPPKPGAADSADKDETPGQRASAG